MMTLFYHHFTFFIFTGKKRAKRHFVTLMPKKGRVGTMANPAQNEIL